MKVTFKTNNGTEDNDWMASYEILINGKSVFLVHDGEPEDNNLSRNFSGIYSLAAILNVIHIAGLNGEVLEYIEEEL